MSTTLAPSSSRRVRVRAFAVALVAGIGGAGAYVLAVQSTIGQAAEASALGAATFSTDPPAPLNLVSAPAALVALILVGGVALAAHGMRRAALATLAPGAAILASQILKLRVLDRPGLFELDAPNTFPSGHMTVFAALLGGLILAVPTRLRGLVAVIGAFVLSAASWQLLAYGWHRPSDIIGALALTIAVFAVATLLAPRAAATRPASGVASLFLVTFGGLALLGGLLLVGIALFVTPSGLERSQLLLLAGEVAGAGGSLLVARSFLMLGRTAVS
ncbi:MULTISPECIES: phosphatase PAP2 family protein [unclassified Leucobacter]|uniref:phosphatase PAP2 family protein n=1 Tax=unclassified Leucobacter TaxID=2621730 RepID=UPI001F13126B|nr:phosphatase PAP2 family protein [Leucobacter sp. CX169]